MCLLLLCGIYLYTLLKDNKLAANFYDLALWVFTMIAASRHSKHLTIHRGEHLFKEGDIAFAAYVLCSGMLEVYQEIDGEHVILGVVGPGEIVGEMALFDDSPRMASIIAVESASLLVIERESFRKQIDVANKTTRHLLLKFISIIREQATAISHQAVLLRKNESTNSNR